MAVEPHKTEARPDHRPAKYRQLAGAFDVGDLQIGRHPGVARRIRQDEKHKRDNGRAADGQAVQPVGQIDRVGTADNREGSQYDANDSAHGAVSDGKLVKRDHDLADQEAGGGQAPEINGHKHRQDALHPKFDELAHSLAVLLCDLGVVVQKAQPAEHHDCQ